MPVLLTLLPTALASWRMTCFLTLPAPNLLCTCGRAPKTLLSIPPTLFSRYEENYWFQGKRYLVIKFLIMVAQMTLLDRMIDFMATAPSTKEILEMKATPSENERISYLLHLNREGKLGREEKRELDAIEMAEHIMRRAKSAAFRKTSGK